MNKLLKEFSKLARFKEFASSSWFRVAQGIMLYIALFLTVSIGILPSQYSLEEGQISPETIYASRTVIDHAATSLARAEAAAAIEDIYRKNIYTESTVISNVSGLMDFLINLDRSTLNAGNTSDGENPKDEIVAHMLEKFPEVENEETALALLEINVDGIKQTRELTSSLIRASMKNEIKEAETEAILQQIKNELYQAQTNPLLMGVVVKSLDTHFIHNSYIDEQATELERRRARDKVEEIRIVKDAKIIDRGDTVTSEHISQLNALGMLQASFAYDYFLGLAVLLLCVFAVWGYYLYKFKPQIFSNPSRVWLLGLILLLTLWAAKLFGGLLFGAGSPYLVPVSMATLLLTIIFDLHTSLFFGMSVSTIIAIMAGSEINVMLVALLGSIAGAYSVTKVNQRSDLTRAGLVVAGINAVVILGVVLAGDGLAMNWPSVKRTMIDIAMGVGGGILASVFAMGLLPFFEMSFGITTSVRLLELANPNQKPLKRLLLEAPGTYHHSILVGNLAEAAAEAVGADPVLARVGSYYHDLGKLTRPYFFIENQFQGSNPHDKIPPSLSSMILTAHVRGGVELANQYKLPPVIKDIIEQHHGTTLIGFFYHRAVAERGSKDQLLEDKFRYDGPKPQFKEAGIIMLADSVEAAVRSLTQPNQIRIQNMISKIVQDKLADGQLEHCDLTLRDLNLITEAFVKVITGIYHKRIAYPTEQDLAKLGS